MAKILSFGINKEYLDARAKALVAQGLKVSSVSQKDEALRLARMMMPDIVIFGHMVPGSLRASLSRNMKKINPECQLIYMYLGSTEGTEMADAILNVESEPTVIADTIKYLVERDKPVSA